MPIPVDGYTNPGLVTYRIHCPGPMVRDVITLEVTLKGETDMTIEEADVLVRQHLEALHREVLTASALPDLELVRTYHGTRDETVIAIGG
jgi:hypothetical protein